MNQNEAILKIQHWWFQKTGKRVLVIWEKQDCQEPFWIKNKEYRGLLDNGENNLFEIII